MNFTQKLAATTAVLALTSAGSVLTADTASADYSNGNCRTNTHRPVNTWDSGPEPIAYRVTKGGATYVVQPGKTVTGPVAEVYVPYPSGGDVPTVYFRHDPSDCTTYWNTQGWKSMGDSAKGFLPDNAQFFKIR